MAEAETTGAGAEEAEPRWTVRQQLFWDLMYINRRLRTQLDRRLSVMDLSFTRWAVLMFLEAHEPGYSQRELAEFMGMAEPTIARHLAAMEARGLISRDSHATDRRANIITIADGARPILGTAENIIHELRKELIEGLPEAELQISARTLAQLRSRLE